MPDKCIVAYERIVSYCGPDALQPKVAQNNWDLCREGCVALIALPVDERVVLVNAVCKLSAALKNYGIITAWEIVCATGQLLHRRGIDG